MESIGKIAGKIPRLSKKPDKDKHLHSANHVLADEISVKLNDRKHFAIYLGMATKLDHQYLRKILGEVLEKKDIQTPGKLFSYLVKKNRN